jgi:peptidoglycan/LPS O-acetylase OafA/YrhL
MATLPRAISSPVPQHATFHIPSLDGLRAVAVLIVFFSHVALTGLVPGGFGVTIFFFLSGFLITTLLRLEAEQTGAISMRNFYLRRGLRILPLMYIVLTAASIATRLIGAPLTGSVVTKQALHLTSYLVLNFNAHAGVGFPIGTIVLWSLAIEEHFYLLFPIALVALRRRLPQPEKQAAVLLAACAVLLAWRCVLILRWHVDPEYVMHATDTRIDSILFGCALALWRNPALPGPQWSDRTVAWACGAALLVLVGTLPSRNVAFRETVRYSIQGLALFPVFIAAIRFPHALPFRILNLRPVSFIGVISYGLYLVHLPIILLLRGATGWPEWRLAGVSLVVALSMATLLYRTIERPCARLRRRLAVVKT